MDKGAKAFRREVHRSWAVAGVDSAIRRSFETAQSRTSPNPEQVGTRSQLWPLTSKSQ